jgi:WD40 repeat protein
MSNQVDQLLQPHKAAILSFTVHPTQPRYIITSSMDSTYVTVKPKSSLLIPLRRAILTDLITLQPLQTFRHAKFVVRCAFSPDGRWLATASYDRTIVLYEDTQWDYRSTSDARAAEDEDEDEDALDEGDDVMLARDPTLRFEERHKIVLDHNPESIVFDAASRHLLYTTRASHLLRYVELPQTGSGSATTTTTSPPFTTHTKSFNPHPDDAHISFAVLNLVLDPTGRMIACQTGDHAGGTGERVLLYDVNLPPSNSPATDVVVPTIASSRTSWLPSRSESSSIPPQNQRLSVIWTGQEGDDYVLPRLAWLPDSSGIITTTTTGWLTMHSLAGETVARLKVHGANAAGSSAGRSGAGQGASEVIRDVCVIGDKDDVRGWRVVSVGYDATVRIS